MAHTDTHIHPTYSHNVLRGRKHVGKAIKIKCLFTKDIGWSLGIALMVSRLRTDTVM